MESSYPELDRFKPRPPEFQRSELQRSELLLALAAGFALSRNSASLTVAESCTGGLVSHWMTSIAGSSRWFDGGIVSYSNAFKISLLDVKEATLNLYGAVSAQTAAEMADGMRRRHRKALTAVLTPMPAAIYALSITGIAGPQGGHHGKPVGSVFFGWAGPSGVETDYRLFHGSRAEIQHQAAAWAVSGLLARLCRA